MWRTSGKASSHYSCCWGLTLLFVSSARSSYRHSDLQLIQPHPLVRSYQSSIKTLIPNCSSQATSLIKSTHSTHLVATGVPFGYYLVTIWLKSGCPILVYGQLANTKWLVAHWAMLNAQRTSALWAAYGQYSKRSRQVPYSRLGYRASCLSRAVHHWAAVSSKQCRCCRLLFVWLSACLLATGNPDQLCSSFLFFLYSQLLWRAYDRGKRWGTNSTAPIFNRHIMIVA